MCVADGRGGSTGLSFMRQAFQKNNISTSFVEVFLAQRKDWDSPDIKESGGPSPRIEKA